VALQTVSPLRALPSPEILVRRIVAIYHLLLLYRVLAIIAGVATISIVLPRASFAQAIPVADRPQAVGVLQFVGSQPNHGPWLYGLNASAEIKSVHFWGVRGDLSAQHWNNYATHYFAGLGPQVYLRRSIVVFHADALEGLSRNRTWIPAPPPDILRADSSEQQQHGYVSPPQTNFAFRAGAGVDANLSNRWLFRIGEVAFTVSFGKHSNHSVGYSTGIAFAF